MSSTIHHAIWKVPSSLCPTTHHTIWKVPPSLFPVSLTFKIGKPFERKPLSALRLLFKLSLKAPKLMMLAKTDLGSLSKPMNSLTSISKGHLSSWPLSEHLSWVKAPQQKNPHDMWETHLAFFSCSMPPDVFLVGETNVELLCCLCW